MVSVCVPMSLCPFVPNLALLGKQMLKPQKRELTKEEKVTFQEYLRKNSGIIFGEEVWKGLEYAVFQRMEEKDLIHPMEYLKYLQSHLDGDNELIELLNLVTIKETHFFRTDSHFAALCEKLLPEILDRHSKEWLKTHIRPSMRIWSAGCSTGEEPYTIALCVLSSMKTADVVEILASDVSSLALRKAYEGQYSKRSVKNVDRQLIAKYFKEEDGKYLIKNEIKSKVKFFQHNLVSDRYPKHVDVIFCRNVTIYFNKETTREIVQKFHKSLNDGGYLLLGHSESLYGLGCENEFELVDLKEAFVYRKVKPQRHLLHKEKAQEKDREKETFARKSKPVEILPHTAERHEAAPSADSLFKEAKEYYEKKLYSKSLDICTKILSLSSKHEGAYLIMGRIYSDMNWHEDAVKTLMRLVEIDSLHVAGHFLLGLSYYKLGKHAEAETQFKKSLYLKPYFALAHFHLANILRESHKYAQALKQYTHALESTAHFSDDSMDLMDGITKDVLRDACKLWIETFKKRV